MAECYILQVLLPLGNFLQVSGTSEGNRGTKEGRGESELIIFLEFKVLFYTNIY